LQRHKAEKEETQGRKRKDTRQKKKRPKAEKEETQGRKRRDE